MGDALTLSEAKMRQLEENLTFEFLRTQGVSFGTSLEKVKLPPNHKLAHYNCNILLNILSDLADPPLYWQIPRTLDLQHKKLFKEQPQECEEERKGITGLQHSREKEENNNDTEGFSLRKLGLQCTGFGKMLVKHHGALRFAMGLCTRQV